MSKKYQVVKEYASSKRQVQHGNILVPLPDVGESGKPWVQMDVTGYYLTRKKARAALANVIERFSLEHNNSAGDKFKIIEVGETKKRKLTPKEYEVELRTIYINADGSLASVGEWRHEYFAENRADARAYKQKQDEEWGRTGTKLRQERWYYEFRVVEVAA